MPKNATCTYSGQPKVPCGIAVHSYQPNRPMNGRRCTAIILKETGRIRSRGRRTIPTTGVIL